MTDGPIPGDPVSRVYLNRKGMWAIASSGLNDGKAVGECEYEVGGTVYAHALQFVRKDSHKFDSEDVEYFVFKHPTKSFFFALAEKPLVKNGLYTILHSTTGEPNSFVPFPEVFFAEGRQIFSGGVGRSFLDTSTSHKGDIVPGE